MVDSDDAIMVGCVGGLEEYQAVKDLMASLSPQYWLCSECAQINRPMAPIMLLIYRRLEPV